MSRRLSATPSPPSMRSSIASLGLLGLLGVTASPHGDAPARRDLSEAFFEASSWYDWGWYGARPHQRYRSIHAASPKPNLVLQSERCEEGLIFLEPRDRQSSDAGLVILDGEGNLVWTATQWPETKNVKVQTFNGSKYMTFWTRDEETSGDGYYVMLDEFYEVFREIRPASSLHGDVQDLAFTSEGTAILTVYHETQAPASKGDPSPRRIYDSVFQEIDLHSGAVLFEWHASHHFSVQESRARCGRRRGDPFDFFHINAVDKDSTTGNYLVSSRFMAAVASISGVDGHVQWQLGGAHNDFEDPSGELATAFSWDHQASWGQQGKNNVTTLTVIDGGRKTTVELDVDEMTMSLAGNPTLQPQKLLHHGQQSFVQLLPNQNVLVSWAHTPGFTEFSSDGEPLCETHLGPVRLAGLGFPSSSYRASKFAWAGRPHTKPALAMRPNRRNSGGSASLYVSWNGATDVDAWVLQSGPEPDGDVFVDHVIVPREGFETKIPVPTHSEEYLRVLALDGEWRFLERSESVSKRGGATTRPLWGKEHRHPRKGCYMLVWIVAGLAMVMTVVHRVIMSRRRRSAVARAVKADGVPSYDYKALPPA
ncbi:leucine-rich repeat-containing protein 40 [Purpureocillium lavendulum]|uniref:Leucine-rich repeat-containing protein 40 n=1 Tax=Purpureocillium lavendulum TaxID=1247861 RepID=A0AB34FL10_9HYPO|nr:leucine-rich repeat-containing protein 40 [Purpureocillium lavendulum]